MDNTSRPSIFVSYAGPDSEFAKWIADGLRKVGIEAKLDQVEIKAGDNVVTWMNKAAGESDYLLVLLSQESVKRYWVEMEWSNALMKEADLRRTFVIPAILPNMDNKNIPFLLRAKAYIDFRKDSEAAFLQLVSRVKDDEIVLRDLGKLPCPAPSNLVNEVEKSFPDSESDVEVIIHSNRFGRSFRLFVPPDTTPSYLLRILRDTLKLKFSNIDETMGVELSYTYGLRHKGVSIPLQTSIKDAGVKEGDRLELWIRVTLRDLLEDKDIGEQVSLHLYHFSLKILSSDVLHARKRAFSSAKVAQLAEQFFKHVDE